MSPDFTNDLTFAENAWMEREARIRKDTFQSNLEKLKRETLANDHAFDVNEKTRETSTKSDNQDTENVLTKVGFDRTVRLDSSDHAFDENDFPAKVAHVVTGKSRMVHRSKQEVFESDHTFDVNNNVRK